MNHIEFLPYHNRHIRFQLQNGRTHSGVITVLGDQSDFSKPDTIYSFIPTHNMIPWKKAEEEKDQDKMNSLESEIDIADIKWAENIN